MSIKKMFSNYAFTSTFGLLTGAFFVCLFSVFSSNIVYVLTHTQSEGKVIGNNKTVPANKLVNPEEKFYPVVEFKTKDGKTLKEVANNESTNSYPQDVIYTVMYDNTNPKTVDLYYPNIFWGRPIIFFILTLMGSIFTYFCFQQDKTHKEIMDNLQPIEVVGEDE